MDILTLSEAILQIKFYSAIPHPVHVASLLSISALRSSLCSSGVLQNTVEYVLFEGSKSLNSSQTELVVLIETRLRYPSIL